ncbi:hypothetical protein CMUS01_05334 [Colletotrichum musicola]|uniref:Uncharacterized protein n=1 Tax=Colletotrichum musicola TaxID=2175873 RepID=A0A8H6NL49_9PEZI|nr:hypothetical protein CMUS01_05334 [Colletotrichum musicola]
MADRRGEDACASAYASLTDAIRSPALMSRHITRRLGIRSGGPRYCYSPGRESPLVPTRRDNDDNYVDDDNNHNRQTNRPPSSRDLNSLRVKRCIGIPAPGFACPPPARKMPASRPPSGVPRLPVSGGWMRAQAHRTADHSPGSQGQILLPMPELHGVKALRMTTTGAKTRSRPSGTCKGSPGESSDLDLRTTLRTEDAESRQRQFDLGSFQIDDMHQ